MFYSGEQPQPQTYIEDRRHNAYIKEFGFYGNQSNEIIMPLTEAEFKDNVQEHKGFFTNHFTRKSIIYDFPK